MNPECCCKYHDLNVQTRTTRINKVDLPLGATEDRVCGTIDIEKALTEGVKAFEPGLLVGCRPDCALPRHVAGACGIGGAALIWILGACDSPRRFYRVALGCAASASPRPSDAGAACCFCLV